MALSDLAVFSEYLYTTQQEILGQQIELFNAASRGTITMATNPMQGDFHTEAFWKRISGLVRRRNPYGSGAVAAKELAMLTDVMVKIAAGTPPINIPPSMFEWIQKSPEEGGVQIGKQLSGDTMADMLNTALMAGVAALKGTAAINYDQTANSPGTADHKMFNGAQALFGDAYTSILAWIMHSKPLFDIFGSAMENTEGLFVFGNVAVRQDAFGRVFVISDSASLRAGSPAEFYSLGLVAGAINLQMNDDFTDNFSTLNGDENIKRDYQAEWSYNLGILGYKWDTANGGKAPNDAALGTTSNWDRVNASGSVKELAGVLVTSE